MKKVIIVLCVALMVVGMVACAPARESDKDVTDKPAMEEPVSFTGVISETSGTSAIVIPNEGSPIRSSGDKVSISIEEGAFEVGDIVIVEHYPEVMESYPLQINMISIEKVE